MKINKNLHRVPHALCRVSSIYNHDIHENIMLLKCQKVSDVDRNARKSNVTASVFFFFFFSILVIKIARCGYSRKENIGNGLAAIQ